jgi:dihydroorotase
MDKITINTPLDMHLHVRDGEMLKNVMEYSSKPFAGGLIMPNTLPPISSREEILSYRKRIVEAIGDEQFEPLMSIFFKSSYDYELLESIKDLILVVKLYPSGVTTNSEGGVLSVDLDEVGETLSAMEKLGIPLSIHGETNGSTFEREAEFLPTYELLAKSFPKLKIIMEHISDRRTIELLDKYENLYATVTLHHLTVTLDDLLGGALKPHLFCKPIVKTSEDRDALQNLVLSGHKKVMFGSDSAPHPQEQKESGNGSAGIFSAPVLLQGVVELFDKNGKLENLQAFLSDNARRIYELNPKEKLVTLEKRNFTVADSYGGVVPLFAGEKLSWSLS